MGQPGFGDVANRYAGPAAEKDPRAPIDAPVPWEPVRPRLAAVRRVRPEDRRSPAGRKPWDAAVMVKAIALGELDNLSDDQLAWQLRDRRSCRRFLGLEDAVPEAKTVGLCRERRARAGVVEALSAAFDGPLKERGWLAMGGRIADAAIVPVPKQRHPREENATIEGGGTPAGRADGPAKRRRKDTDARRTKGHGRSRYGHTNHVGVDRRPKLVRRGHVTDASVHDRRVVDEVLDAANTASDVWADSACRAAASAARLQEKGPRSRLQRQGRRTRPLTERERRGDRTRSTARARVEHGFGARSNATGGVLVRRIGLVRAEARIGLKNRADNMRRLVQLERLAAAAA